MLQAILIIPCLLFLSFDYSYAGNPSLQGKADFEREVIAEFSKDVGRDNVIQENKPSKGIEGLKGRKSPDLLTIDKDGFCTMWETKSPAEAKGKAWFVNRGKDYIAPCRSKYAAERDRVRNDPSISKHAKKAKIDCLAWSIVIGCQMRHYADNYKNEWRLPASKSNACDTINRIGLIAPIGYEISNTKLYDNVEAIKCAFETLGIKGEVKPKGNKIYASFTNNAESGLSAKIASTPDKVRAETVVPEKQTAHAEKAAAQVEPIKSEAGSKSGLETISNTGESPGKSKAPGIISSLKEEVANSYRAIRNRAASFIDETLNACKDFYRNVSSKISSFVSSSAEKVSKLYHAIGEYFTKLKSRVTQSLSLEKAPTVAPSANNSQNTIVSKTPGPVGQSSFGRIVNGLTKVSVAFSIVFSGYTMTKEVYEKTMQGVTVHPSRVLARGIVGFAGALAGGIALGALCAMLTIVTGWGAVILGAIGAFVGTVAGGIGAEWLYEWIVPMDGFGWAIGDFLLGGLLGSILGVFPGMIGGLTIASVRNSLTPAPKMLPKGKKLRKKIMNACINGCRKVKHWADKKARKRRYATCGLCLGFVFGGFFMATTFLYLFN